MTTMSRPANPEDLHTVDAARARILNSVPVLPDEIVFIPAAEGRVLAEELRSTRALPAFDNSAMDGVGVRVADVEAARTARPRLKLVGASLAGGALIEMASGGLPPGHAVRIMTGAPVPEGVQAVVMREHTDETDVSAGYISVLEPATFGQHIRRMGEDVALDAVVGRPGDVLTPARMNLLLSAGHVTARIRRRPVVAIMASGDELKEVGLPAGPHDIVNSNAHAIAAAARQAGCVVQLIGIARDSLEDHVRRINAAQSADVLITIGGVSMGTHDFVRPALHHVGATLDMWRVAMRPGKPVAFGRKARGDACDLVIFGLPGNPVSAMVSFELFVRPALLRMMGVRAVLRPQWRAKLVERPFSKKAGLEHWARGEVRLQDGELRVVLADGQGSHHVSAMARGNALVRIGIDVTHVDVGTDVDVMMLAEPMTDADMY